MNIVMSATMIIAATTVICVSSVRRLAPGSSRFIAPASITSAPMWSAMIPRPSTTWGGLKILTSSP